MHSLMSAFMSRYMYLRFLISEILLSIFSIFNIYLTLVFLFYSCFPYFRIILSVFQEKIILRQNLKFNSLEDFRKLLTNLKRLIKLKFLLYSFLRN